MKCNQISIVLFGILVVCSMVFSGCVNTPASPNPNTTISGTIVPATTVTAIIPGKITAQVGDNVSVIYTGKLDNGVIFDTNVNGTPISFTLGDPGVIDGFQEAVTGMAVNEEKNVTIPYMKAYGPHRDDLVHLLPLMGPLENESFVEGTYVTITNKTDNSYSIVKILNVTPDTVTWDANDPLAGEDLTFDIRVTGIERK